MLLNGACRGISAVFKQTWPKHTVAKYFLILEVTVTLLDAVELPFQVFSFFSFGDLF